MQLVYKFLVPSFSYEFLVRESWTVCHQLYVLSVDAGRNCWVIHLKFLYLLLAFMMFYHGDSYSSYLLKLFQCWPGCHCYAIIVRL